MLSALRSARTLQLRRSVCVRPLIRLQGNGTAALTSEAAPRTMYDKIWADHVVDEDGTGTSLVFIDRHLVHEVLVQDREAFNATSS